NYNQAENLFLRVLELTEPNSPEAVELFYLIGNCATAQGDYVRALEYLERVLATEFTGIDKIYTKSLLAYGTILRRKGDLEHAEMIALQAGERAKIANDPYGECGARYLRSAIALHRRDFDSARALAEANIEFL